MATSTVVILSSPARSFSEPGSSPLPPLEEIFKPGRNAFKSGSRIAAIPEGANLSFCSARSILVDQLDSSCEESLQQTPKHTESMKQAKTRKDGMHVSNQLTTARDAEDSESSSRLKAPSSGTGPDAQQSRLEGKIVKPGIDAGRRMPKFLLPLSDAGHTIATVSCGSRQEVTEGFPTASLVAKDASQTTELTRESKQSTGASVVMKSDAVEVAEGPRRDFICTVKENEQDIDTVSPFKDLQGDYGFNQQSALRPAFHPTEITGEPVAKRRKVSPSKASKPPTKSSRTVTKIALAQYRPAEESITAATHDIDSFYPPKKPLEAPVGMASKEDGASEKKAAAQKRKRKTKPKSKSNAKDQRPIQKLLAPEDAVQRFDRQDLFFGTSSQLVSEEPLSYIRELQQATKESETFQNAALSPGKRSTDGMQGNDVPKTRPRSSTRSEQRMWNVSSRDEHDSVFDGTPWISVKQSSKPQKQASPVDDFTDIDALAPSFKKQPAEPPTKEMKYPLTFPAASRPTLLCMNQHRSFLTTLDTRKDSRSPEKASDKKSTEPSSKAVSNAKANAKKSAKPSEASEKTDKTGPKRPRGRPRKDAALDGAAPITTVKRSRKSKKAQAELPVQPVLESTAKADEAKEGPTVQTSTKRLDFDEIEDSDPGPTPSPPRRGSQTPVIQQLELSPSKMRNTTATESVAAPKTAKRKRGRKADQEPGLDDKDFSSKELTADIFPFITRAIKTAPRGVITAPSWYEKILLYDPIVLEDITTWLNDGQLVRAGRDSEALPLRPSVVQKWCEASSICCLWKESLWGNRRKAY
ncbi:MAG: 5'-flap endonuclease [Chrysothrix sp. TS-e1954]|nr:MAG: 5'-flap endonuclease [Chrysothrix sp. TS-e1954]